MPGSTPLLFSELREHLPAYTTGILPSQSIEELIAAGHMTGTPAIAPDQIQPSSLDLRISGRNLKTWTKYTGLDPETNVAQGLAKIPGSDYFNLPLSRSVVFTVGLNR